MDITKHVRNYPSLLYTKFEFIDTFSIEHGSLQLTVPMLSPADLQYFLNSTIELMHTITELYTQKKNTIKVASIVDSADAVFLADFSNI